MNNFDNEIDGILSEDFSKVRSVVLLIEQALRHNDLQDDIGHEDNITGGIQVLIKLSNGTSVEEVDTDDLVLALKTYHSLAKLVKKVAGHMEEALHTLEIMKKSGHVDHKTNFNGFN